MNQVCPRHFTLTTDCCCFSNFTDHEDEQLTEDLFDPTGYVPLPVMIRQQQLAGEALMLQRKMFDYEDWNDIYMDEPIPEFADDFEAMEYLQKIERKKQEVMAQRQAEFQEEYNEFLKYRSNKNQQPVPESPQPTVESNQQPVESQPPADSN